MPSIGFYAVGITPFTYLLFFFASFSGIIRPRMALRHLLSIRFGLLRGLPFLLRHGKSDGSLLPVGLALESLDLPVGELSEILVFVLDDHNLAFAADEQQGDHNRVQDRHDAADNKDNDQDKTVERN